MSGLWDPSTYSSTSYMANQSHPSSGGGGRGSHENIVAFTGTNTGNVYRVGQSYTMNGDRYVANQDGSFQNMRTGQILDGSSMSMDATFYRAQSTSGGTGPGPGTGNASSRGNGVGTAGPGNVGAATGRAGTGPGVPGATTSRSSNLPSPFGGGPGGPRATAFQTQQVGGLTLLIDQSFPNVEDFWEPRYGEPGEFVGGIVNIAADVVANDRAGNIDRWAADAIRQSITVHPGGVADHVVRFTDNFYNGPATRGGQEIPISDPMRSQYSGPQYSAATPSVFPGGEFSRTFGGRTTGGGF